MSDISAEQTQAAVARLQSQLADADLGAMLGGIAQGVAQAQYQLDLCCISIARVMAGDHLVVLDERGRPGIIPGDSRMPWAGGKRYSLLELGFSPPFYQFKEATLEVKVSISMSADVSMKKDEFEEVKTEEKVNLLFYKKTKTSVSTTESHFAASYGYSIEGSSSVRAKLIPTPMPPEAMEALRVAVEDSAKK